MNSFDKITGSTAATDSLDIALINASGADIGGASAAVPQVNKITLATVVPDVAQITYYTFSGTQTAGDTLRYTIDGVSNSASATSTTANSLAVPFAASLTALGYTTVVGTVSSGVFTADGAGGTGGVVKVTGTKGVPFGLTVNSATAAVNIPVVNSGITGTAAVDGNEGDTVTFTYNGLSGSYVIGATNDATATNLKNALTSTIPTSQAVAAVVDNSTSDFVTLTAGTAGVPLSALTFSGTGSNVPVMTTTTANVTAGGGISFGATTGVEILNLTNDSGSKATVSQNAIKSATQLWSDNSANAVAWTDVGKTTALGIRGDGTALAEGAVTGTYVAGTTSATLAVSAANAGAVQINGNADGKLVTQNVTSTNGAQAASAGTVNSISSLALATSTKTLNVDAATSLSTGNITGDALTTINVKGTATTVTLNATSGALPATVTTVDGSGLTAGGITATLNTAIKNFTGGAGVDTVTTAATTAIGAVINAGGGSGDILNLAATYDVTTAAKAAQYTNFEILRNTITGTSGAAEVRNIDMSLFNSYTGVQANAVSHVSGGTTYVNGAGFINLTATQAANVTNRSDNNGARLTLADSTGSADVLTVTLNNGTATTGPTLSADLTSVNVSGFETMNVVSSSGTSSDVSALSFASSGAGALTALNVTGAAPLALNTAHITKGVTINASAMTFAPTAGNYAFDVQGAVVKGSSITGSATGANKFVTDSSAVSGASGDYVTYTGGSGDDSFSTNFTIINNTSSSSASLKLNAGDGKDTLAIAAVSNVVTATDASFQYLSGFDIIEIAKHTGATTLTTGGFFNNAFANGVTLTDSVVAGTGTAAGASYNLSTYNANADLTITSELAGTAAGSLSVLTGSGNDTISLTANALTSALVTINSGQGNDAISFTNKGTATRAANTVINGGAGQDTITLDVDGAAEAELLRIDVNAGQSTISAYDSVTGFVLAGTSGSSFKSNIIDFDGTNTVASLSTTAVAGYSAGQLSIAVSSAGVVSFTGTMASTLDLDLALSAIQIMVPNAGNTAVYVSSSGDSYVYNAGSSTATSNDSFVMLENITVLGLATEGTTAASGTNGFVFFA